MKILMVHNFYQNTGGEDLSYKAEANLLEKHGHTLIRYTRDNAEINDYDLLQKMRLATSTIWSRKTFRELSTILQITKPDIVHFQNTFPLISPSAFVACERQKIPIVMNLRNYRRMCLNGLFLRDAQICEDCLNKKIAWPGVFHACYRNSFLQSGVVAMMNAYHRMRKTWIESVNSFICLSEFSKEKYKQGGLPEKQIQIIPNFMEDPGKSESSGEYSIFIGRLSEEKGIGVLLNAVEMTPDVPVWVIGSGLLEKKLKPIFKDLKHLKYLGQLPHNQTILKLKHAKYLIFPSLHYETFGRTIMEAYACGKPVIAFRIGPVHELVKDGITGLLVNPGDPEDLSEKMRWLWEHPKEACRMGENARKYYLENLTPEIHYESLMQIYTSVLEGKK